MLIFISITFSLRTVFQHPMSFDTVVSIFSVSECFKISVLIIFMTHWLFRRVLFNLHIFVSFPTYLLVMVLVYTIVIRRNTFVHLLLSLVQLFAISRTIAHQASLSMEFSRHEYWSEKPFFSPEDLNNSRIGPGSPACQADSLPSEPPGKKYLVLFKSYEFFKTCVGDSAVKNLPAKSKRCRFDPWFRKIPLEKEMTPHPKILAWKIPWTEEPCRLHGVAKSQTRLKDWGKHKWVLIGHLRRMFILLLLNGVSFLCMLDIWPKLGFQNNVFWLIF